MLLGTIGKALVGPVSSTQTQTQPKTQTQAQPPAPQPEPQPTAPRVSDAGVIFDLSPAAQEMLAQPEPAASPVPEIAQPSVPVAAAPAAPLVVPALVAPITMAEAGETAPGRAAPTFSAPLMGAGMASPATDASAPADPLALPEVQAEEARARAFAESQLLRDRLLELATRAYQETQRMQQVQDRAAPSTTPAEAARGVSGLRQALTAA